MIELPYIRLYSFIHHKFFNVVGFVFLLKPFFVRVCSEESWGWPHAKCLSPSKEWMFWMCCRIRSSRSSLHSAAQYQTWFTILLTQGINSSFSFFFATSTDFLRIIFAKCQTSKWHSSFMYFLICTCQSLQKVLIFISLSVKDAKESLNPSNSIRDDEPVSATLMTWKSNIAELTAYIIVYVQYLEYLALNPRLWHRQSPMTVISLILRRSCKTFFSCLFWASFSLFLDLLSSNIVSIESSFNCFLSGVYPIILD